MDHRWVGLMPGVLKLEKELGVNRNTIEAAMKLLEEEGILLNLGRGKKKRIVLAEKERKSVLNVGILSPDTGQDGWGHYIEFQRQLEQSGCKVFKHQIAISSDRYEEQLNDLVISVRADAWVVVAGQNKTLAWFCDQNIPVFAMFGRDGGLPISSARPNKTPQLVKVVQRLSELGHKRIVLLARSLRRLPTPGRFELAFLESLESLGIAVSSYNMPHWDDSAEGLNQCLKNMFNLTPPTAIIADEADVYLAVYQYCCSHGIVIPDELSLICTDNDPVFNLLVPEVSRIDWDLDAFIAEVLKWLSHIKNGIDPQTKVLTEADFVEGGTIAPLKT